MSDKDGVPNEPEAAADDLRSNPLRRRPKYTPVDLLLSEVGVDDEHQQDRFLEFALCYDFKIEQRGDLWLVEQKDVGALTQLFRHLARVAPEAAEDEVVEGDAGEEDDLETMLGQPSARKNPRKKDWASMYDDSTEGDDD